MINKYSKTILIVDDSASIRREARVILEKDGYSVREAGTEFGLFNSVDQYGKLVDLIVMDLSLNDAYGLDMVAKLRNTERFRSIPVVMLTQHSDRESVEMARMVGVQGYLVKPINPALLLERVEKVLEEAASR